MLNRCFHAAVRLLACALGMCLAATITWPAEKPPDEDQRVLAIRLVRETGEVLEENVASLPLRPGEPYNSDAIRESLRELYLTGRFADVRAETAPVEGGLRLDFIVQENYFVNAVHVSGLREPPNEAQALAAMHLALGEIFRLSTLDEALERLRGVLEEEGFYQADIKREFTPHPDTRQMDITAQVTPGPRARIGAIEVHNQTEYPSKKVLGISKLKSGRAVTSARLNRSAERVRKFLAKKGHLGARVNVRRGQYDKQANAVPLVVEISAGPKVRLEVTGVGIPSGELRRLVPIYQEGAVDEDLLQEGRRAVRDYLERRGYFDPEVRYKTGAAGKAGEQVIIYEVNPGPRRRLVGVSFEGNKYFSDDLLRSRLRIEPAAFLSQGRFTRRLLQEDEASMRELYRASGFREARVEGRLLEDYAGKEGELFVRFHINEGPQTLVEKIEIQGNQALDDDALRGVVGSTAGQPYSEFNVSSDRDNILALYYNEGFPHARFESEVSEANPGGGVRLTYRVTEGPQMIVNRVLIAGNDNTRPGIIARQVQLGPGEPLRQGELVETQRRLYDLGIFTRVSIAPQNPEGTDPGKTLVVLVEEAKRYTVSYGVGFEVQRLGGGGSDPVGGELRASPRGLFEITRANFTGRPHTLSFRARASTLQGRALLSYNALNFLARPDFNLLLTGFADRTRDVRTFTSTRYEASVQLVQRISLVTSLLYRYSFRRVLVDPESLRVSPEEIPLFSQPTQVSALAFSWVRDRRDNPSDAARGDFNTMDLSFAAVPLGSTATFARLFIQNSTFHPMGRRFVFARSTRLGIQEPLGRSTAFDIPLPERFFAGGGTSLRGFGLNQAGPRDPDTGFPIGGQAMLIFNQELRFPMRLPFVGGRLGGALFYDAGNVFSRANRITLRASPISPDDLNYFSHTIGFSFRYATPIGPVRLDLGYQLNPAEFSFTTDTGTQLVRLPRFQFFFNIGSIF
jgi:outer membrane protein assembly complex protein YaeT